MKIETLQLGNLFKEKYSGTIIEVEGITKDVITFSGKFNNEWQAEEIPLTFEEITKLGFKYDSEQSNYHYKHSHWLRVQILTKEGGILLIDGKQFTFLDYVHELQNIVSTLLKEKITFS